MVGRRRCLCGLVGSFAAFMLAVPPVGADVVDGVPVIQDTQIKAGGTRQQPLDSPGDGFTDATAEPSDPSVVTVNNTPKGIPADKGVSFTFGQKKGVAVITVIWTNPKTHEKRKQFVVVNTSLRGVAGVDTATHTAGATQPVKTKRGDTVDPNPQLAPGTYVVERMWGVLIISVEPKPASGPRTAPVAPRPAAPDEGGNKG